MGSGHPQLEALQPPGILIPIDPMLSGLHRLTHVGAHKLIGTQIYTEIKLKLKKNHKPTNQKGINAVCDSSHN